MSERNSQTRVEDNSSSSSNAQSSKFQAPEMLILHLSDLHFGSKSRYADHNEKSAEELGKNFFKEVNTGCEQSKISRKIDLVIVSGDLSETGKPSEFRMALHFLRGLGGAIGLDDSRFIFVPGNHDVSWAECQRVDLDIQDELLSPNERKKVIDERKLKFYDQFITDFHSSRCLTDISGTRRLSKGAWLHDFPDLRLSVAALNSCEQESHDKSDHIGKISSNQAQSLLTAWTETAYQNWLKLAVVHHNPVMTTPDNIASWRKQLMESKIEVALLDRYEADVTGIQGSEHLKQICDGALVQAILHGHHHATGSPIGWPTKGGGSAWVLSTGSWGLSDSLLGNERPSCQLLHFVFSNLSKIFRYRLVFDKNFWLRGAVEQGHFRLLAQTSYDDGLIISLPEGFVPPIQKSTPASKGLSDDLHRFIKTYRDRMRGLFTSWDLRPVGTTQAGGAGQAVEAGLDDMYLPLRFAPKYDPDITDEGKLLTPDSLISRQPVPRNPKTSNKASRKSRKAKKRLRSIGRVGALNPIAIRAPAGSGKTTWMRYTFRQLLLRERALPVMIVLRDVAALWKDRDVTGADRSIDQFLDHWVNEHLGTGWNGRIRELFEATKQAGYSGPRVLLFVDGWDELGDLGRDFRAKLEGIRNEFPNIQIVVTSRPYGDERPTESGGYEEVTIQPLSDGEIEQLACNFFSRCYKLEPKLVNGEWAKFESALKRSPEANSLARTALLLTMMLLISRSETLPDKRHQLYDRCIHNLLTALPQTRASGGALDLAHQWRPTDSDERRRVVARLAFDLQDSGYKSANRGAIIADWNKVTGFLPNDWKPEQRDGFVAWLTGPSGVLTDRSDETVVFAHLSFQEFMAAWHLKANCSESSDLMRNFETRLENTNWWETLLLCGALVGAENQERMDMVLKRLCDLGDAGLRLAGLLLADGIGGTTFGIWAKKWSEALSQRRLDDGDTVSNAWRASQQHIRRQELGRILGAEGANAHWVGWLRLRGWMEQARLNGPLTPSHYKLSTSVISDVNIFKEPSQVAMGRFREDVIKISQIGYLQLLRTPRQICGNRLQLAASLGVSLSEMLQILRKDLQELKRNRFSELNYQGNEIDFILGFYFPIDETWPHYFNLSLHNHRVGPQIIHDFADNLSNHPGIDNISVNSTQEFMIDYFRGFDVFRSGNESRQFGSLLEFVGKQHRSPQLIAKFAQGLARRWGLELTDWINDLVETELASYVGRVAAQFWMAERRPSDTVGSLIRRACELFPKKWQRESVVNALSRESSGLDPVWPALALHVAGLSTAADRALLTDLIQNPEKREPPLFWALQFFLRGDVMLENGEIKTLDELAKNASVETLPYLLENTK